MNHFQQIHREYQQNIFYESHYLRKIAAKYDILKRIKLYIVNTYVWIDHQRK